MMRIAFDYQAFFIQEYGGITRYYSRLAGALNALAGVESRIFAPLHINGYLADLPAGVVRGLDVSNWPRRKKLFRGINVAVSRIQMGLYQPSVVHETYYSLRTGTPREVPVVATVHDMIHERFSAMFRHTDRTSRLKRAAVDRADHVVCVSHSTRNDLMDYFGTSEEKISVVHHGFEALGVGNVGPELHALASGRPYFLFVGHRSIYKNFNNFIRAFASSSELKRNYNVVCFGGGALHIEERRALSALGLDPSQVVQVAGDDAALAHCYRHAFALVYPSTYEGFGFPPLEAMALDCPVICSRTSSIPEVAGEAAEYFEPASVDSIRDGLERVASSSSRRSELVCLGRERYRLFTWPRCARETLAVYERIV
jgi:glycosyltransferase involved in cell wall biosynthesis